RKAGHLVIGAAQLEREDRLQVLALEENGVAQPLGQGARRLERRLARHVVDARFQDALEIIGALHRQNLAWTNSRACSRPASSPRRSFRCRRKRRSSPTSKRNRNTSPWASAWRPWEIRWAA